MVEVLDHPKLRLVGLFLVHWLIRTLVHGCRVKVAPPAGIAQHDMARHGKAATAAAPEARKSQLMGWQLKRLKGRTA